jgi:hypothetical protein
LEITGLDEFRALFEMAYGSHSNRDNRTWRVGRYLWKLRVFNFLSVGNTRKAELKTGDKNEKQYLAVSPAAPDEDRNKFL